jgi:DNA-binding transcriptional ArsR family regulator
MSRQAIAKHLAVMRDAGLIEVSTVGRTSVHSLNRDALRRATGWLSTIANQEDSP